MQTPIPKINQRRDDKKLKLPKELNEKQKKKRMKIKKKEFKQPIGENEELLMKAFLFHCHIKNVSIADLEPSEISDHWMNFLEKLERNKDKKNIYSELYEIWSEILEKELKRKKETKTYSTQSPLEDDRDLHETLIRHIF